MRRVPLIASSSFVFFCGCKGSRVGAAVLILGLAVLFLPLVAAAEGEATSAPPAAGDGRVAIPLQETDKSISVRKRKNTKVEWREGDGLRLVYTNPEQETKGWLAIYKKFDRPAAIAAFGFDLKVSEGERPFVSLTNEDGQSVSVTPRAAGGDDEFLSFEIDVTSLQSKGEWKPSDATSHISISVPVLPSDGEHVVELRNFWMQVRK